MCAAKLKGCVQANDVTSERRMSLKGPLHCFSTVRAASPKVYHKLLFIWTLQALEHNFTSHLQKQVVIWGCSASSLLTLKKLFNKEKKTRAPKDELPDEGNWMKSIWLCYFPCTWTIKGRLHIRSQTYRSSFEVQDLAQGQKGTVIEPALLKLFVTTLNHFLQAKNGWRQSWL